MRDLGRGCRARQPTAPVLADTLFRMHERYPRPQHDRFLFAAHLIRLLATSPKDRTSDDMASWAKQSVSLGEAMPEIPDFALDMHTRAGAERGRDYRYFLEEASRVSPEIEGRETKYRDWLLAAIQAGKIS